MTKLDSILGFLAEHYIESFPRDAARILEQQSNLSLVRGFISGLNLKKTLLVFEHLNSHLALECLISLSLERVEDILKELPPERSAALLRICPKGKREAFLKELPQKLSNTLHALIHFPEDTAGGMMSPTFLEVEEEQTVGQARALSKNFAKQMTQFIYLRDEHGLFCGKVSMVDFLRSEDAETLQDIKQSPKPQILVGSTLAEILVHPGWKEFSELPVVNEENRLVGTLSFQKFLSLQQSQSLSGVKPMTTFLRLLEAGWVGMMATCQELSQVVQSESRKGEIHDH